MEMKQQELNKTKSLLTESYEKFEELKNKFKDANIRHDRLQEDIKRFVRSQESQLLSLQYQLRLSPYLFDCRFNGIRVDTTPTSMAADGLALTSPNILMNYLGRSLVQLAQKMAEVRRPYHAAFHLIF